MTDLDLDKLRELAQAATPGPWQVGPPDQGSPYQVCISPDAAYIAAADPTTVLALIDRIATLEAALSEERIAAALPYVLRRYTVADRPAALHAALTEKP